MTGLHLRAQMIIFNLNTHTQTHAHTHTHAHRRRHIHTAWRTARTQSTEFARAQGSRWPPALPGLQHALFTSWLSAKTCGCVWYASLEDSATGKDALMYAPSGPPPSRARGKYAETHPCDSEWVATRNEPATRNGRSLRLCRRRRQSLVRDEPRTSGTARSLGCSSSCATRRAVAAELASHSRRLCG